MSASMLLFSFEYGTYVCFIFSFTGTVFQAGSEWPSSGYKQIERGLLLDFGFNSTPLVKCLLSLINLIEEVELGIFYVYSLINVEYVWLFA